jgi:hypothetical protein
VNTTWAGAVPATMSQNTQSVTQAR